MKLQALEARLFRVLVRSEVPPYYARKAALAIVRDTHEQRVREIRQAAARGLSCREIAKLVGIGKSHVARVLSHRSDTDGTPDRPTIGPRTERQDAAA